MFRGGELCYEICLWLRFYGSLGPVLYVELTKLDSLLYNSSNSLRFIHRFFNRLIRHYYDWVSLKVLTKLSEGYY